MPNAARLTVRTEGFKAFAKAMGVAVPLALRANLKVAFLAAGALVAGDAKEMIEPYSSSIPDSIKVRMTGLASVTISASGRIAGLMELGNAKGRSADTFRHPVFGNPDVWVSQPMHPYLAPALKVNEDEIQVLTEAAMDSAIAEGLIYNVVEDVV